MKQHYMRKQELAINTELHKPCGPNFFQNAQQNASFASPKVYSIIKWSQHQPAAASELWTMKGIRRNNLVVGNV